MFVTALSRNPSRGMTLSDITAKSTRYEMAHDVPAPQDRGF
jgi:hypothetical protein